MNVDVGRAAVYAAEAVAFEGTDLESVRPLAEVVAVIHTVVGSAWWPGVPVQVIAARSDAGSSSTRCAVGETTVIRLAAEQTTIATAAHELAHALAGAVVGHSDVFLAAYLDVVEVITNLDSRDRRHQVHVDQLRAAFEAAGLEVGLRQWQAPPDGTGTAIAL